MHISQYMGKKWTFHMGRFVGFNLVQRSPTFPLTAWREWQRIWWSCHEDLRGHNDVWGHFWDTWRPHTDIGFVYKRMFFYHSSHSKSPLNHHLSHEKYWKAPICSIIHVTHPWLCQERARLIFRSFQCSCRCFCSWNQTIAFVNQWNFLLYSGLWKRHKLRMNWDGNVLHVSEFLLSVI